MPEIDPQKVSPRIIQLAASQPQPSMNHGGVIIPGRGPVNMPMAMPLLLVLMTSRLIASPPPSGVQLIEIVPAPGKRWSIAPCG